MRVRLLLLFLLFVLVPTAQAVDPLSSTLPVARVATLPPATISPHLVYKVIDGTSVTDCTVGGGLFEVICQPTGSVWQSVGGSGGGGGGGFADQAARTVFAGPLSGSPAQPAFRLLRTQDLITTDVDVQACTGGSLAGCVADLGLLVRTIVVTTNQSIAGVTVPANLTLDFSRSDAMLNCGDATTIGLLTINGPIIAPDRQIFDHCNTRGVVRLSSLSSGRIVPQWWGAKADAGEDITAAVASGSTTVAVSTDRFTAADESKKLLVQYGSTFVTGNASRTIAADNGTCGLAGACQTTGSVATFIDTAAHTYIPGLTVTITGVVPGSATTFDGTYTIASVPTPTSFTVSHAGTAGHSGGGGTSVAAAPTEHEPRTTVAAIHSPGGVVNARTITLDAPAPIQSFGQTVAVTSVSRTSTGYVTLSTDPALHRFREGQSITVRCTGFGDTSFDGHYLLLQSDSHSVGSNASVLSYLQTSTTVVAATPVASDCTATSDPARIVWGTDYSTQINAALGTADCAVTPGGGRVVLPRGEYYHGSTTLLVGCGTTFVGEGMDKSILYNVSVTMARGIIGIRGQSEKPSGIVAGTNTVTVPATINLITNGWLRLIGQPVKMMGWTNPANNRNDFVITAVHDHDFVLSPPGVLVSETRKIADLFFISTIGRSGGTVTVITTVPNDYATGDWARVTGVTGDTSFNATTTFYEITVINPTTFTFKQPGADVVPFAGGGASTVDCSFGRTCGSLRYEVHDIYTSDIKSVGTLTDIANNPDSGTSAVDKCLVAFFVDGLHVERMYFLNHSAECIFLQGNVDNDGLSPALQTAEPGVQNIWMRDNLIMHVRGAGFNPIGAPHHYHFNNNTMLYASTHMIEGSGRDCDITGNILGYGRGTSTTLANFSTPEQFVGRPSERCIFADNILFGHTGDNGYGLHIGAGGYNFDVHNNIITGFASAGIWVDGTPAANGNRSVLTAIRDNLVYDNGRGASTGCTKKAGLCLDGAYADVLNNKIYNTNTGTQEYGIWVDNPSLPTSGYSTVSSRIDGNTLFGNTTANLFAQGRATVGTNFEGTRVTLALPANGNIVADGATHKFTCAGCDFNAAGALDLQEVEITGPTNPHNIGYWLVTSHTATELVVAPTVTTANKSCGDGTANLPCPETFLGTMTQNAFAVTEGAHVTLAKTTTAPTVNPAAGSVKWWQDTTDKMPEALNSDGERLRMIQILPACDPATEKMVRFTTEGVPVCATDAVVPGGNGASLMVMRLDGSSGFFECTADGSLAGTTWAGFNTGANQRSTDANTTPELDREILAPRAGTLHQFYAHFWQGIPAGETVVLTIRYDHADTTITCTATAGVGAVDCSSTVPTVPVTQGHPFALRAVCSGGTTAIPTGQFTLSFE